MARKRMTKEQRLKLEPEVLKLRNNGYTFAEIAWRLGISEYKAKLIYDLAK